MPSRVLLLNADAQPLSLLPLSTVSWQNAVKVYFQDKARILHSYENDILHAANFAMEKPSVIILNHYHKTPTTAKFTRKNLFLRDSNVCQYCGNKFSYDELTIDHVLPRVAGGTTTWMNCVAACMPCNSKKGKKLIKPLNKPYRPGWHEINQHAKNFDVTIPDPNWQIYIQWPEDKLNINQKEK
jgi:5-methylcytosine-specific restriction endonuclease McrA